MARVQKQDAAPLKELYGRQEVGRRVEEGSPCHSSAVAGASLDNVGGASLDRSSSPS